MKMYGDDTILVCQENHDKIHWLLSIQISRSSKYIILDKAFTNYRQVAHTVCLNKRPTYLHLSESKPSNSH